MLNQRPCSLLISPNHTERTTGALRLATGPLRIPSSVSEYYIDYRQSLFGVLTAKDCRNNYHTETLVGKPYWAWSGIFAEFPHLPVKDLGKGRLDNRRQKQLLEDVDLNININTCRTATRQLRELDGAKSEGNFEKLAHWCAFQRQGFKPGVGKNKKEGFGNCVWRVVYRRHVSNHSAHTVLLLQQRPRQTLQPPVFRHGDIRSGDGGFY